MWCTKLCCNGITAVSCKMPCRCQYPGNINSIKKQAALACLTACHFACHHDDDTRMPPLSQAAPWKVSDAYVAILKDKKLASFLLKGIGDPTARGRGFSFMREEVKKHGKHDAPGPGVTSREDGTITGKWSCESLTVAAQLHLLQVK